MNVFKINDFGNAYPDLHKWIISLRRYFGKVESLVEILYKARHTGVLEVPGYFSADNKCARLISFKIGEQKVFGVYVVLCFENEGKIFYIIQHHSFVAAVFIPEKEIFVCIQSIFFDKHLIILEELDNFQANCITLSEGRFDRLFFLNGYQRPYHFFYDRFPYLLRLKNELKFDDADVLTIKGGDFANDNSWRVLEYDSMRVELQKNNALALIPVPSLEKLPRKDLSNLVARFFKGNCSNNKNKISNDSSPTISLHKLNVWIGLCQEKRLWLEQKYAIAKMIQDVIAYQSSTCFFFDGMTAKPSEDKSTFRELNCQKEISILHEILDLVGVDFDFVDLIGETYKNKIEAGEKVDVFFCNALTDSMVPAHFCYKPGLVYASPAAKLDFHNHPFTVIFPRPLVSDVESVNDNWARKNISIDPEVISKQFLLLVKSICD